jgi:hypothetical protein
MKVNNVLVVSGINRPTSRELGVGSWELADINHINFVVLSNDPYWLAKACAKGCKCVLAW